MSIASKASALVGGRRGEVCGPKSRQRGIGYCENGEGSRAALDLSLSFCRLLCASAARYDEPTMPTLLSFTVRRA